MTHTRTKDQFDQESLLDRIIGAQLTRLRSRCGLSLSEMATLTGIPEPLLQDHESGELPLPLARIRWIAAALDRPTIELMAELLFPGC